MIISQGKKEDASQTINNNLKAVQVQYNTRGYQMKYGMLQASTEPYIKSAIRRGDKAYLRKQLKAWKEYRPNVDLWTIVGPDAVTIAALNTPVSGLHLSINGLVERAIETRRSIVSTEILSGEILVVEGLAGRAASVDDTLPAVEVTDGMLLVVVTPVTDSADNVLGAIVTADLINHDTFVPDTSAEMIPDAIVSIAMGARIISTNATDESGARSIGEPIPARILDELGAVGSFRGERIVADREYIVAYDPILNHRGDLIGSISVELPKERFAELQSTYVKGIIGIAMLALFLASGVGAFIAYVITRPIESLTRRARRISSGDLRPWRPSHTAGNDEIAELARTFDGMLRSLNENEERISAAQAKLSQQKNLVESIINSLPYCIYVLGRDLAIIDWNSHSLRPCPICRCIPGKDCLGMDFIEHLPPHELRDGLAAVIRSVFDSGAPRHLEQGLTIDEASGKKAYIRTSIFPILSQAGHDGGERVDYVVWMAEDITEKKDMEANIITSEKLSAVGELAAGVAHEVNNPLGGILNCLDNFKNRPLSDERKAEYLEFMKDGIVRVQNIVRQLMDFSQQHIPELRRIDINSIIEEMKPLFAHTIKDRKIKIVTDFDRSLKPILADKHQIEQILVNLTLNAIQAVEGGGLIELSTKAMRSWCLITVSDNGSGIPAGDIPRIFDPFFTTKGVGKGTGLGLSVSRGIIERHKGRIEVESRVGVGTVFKVYLPFLV
jgi:signal transduction histidine kinase/HAMP domain-containing protein